MESMLFQAIWMVGRGLICVEKAVGDILNAWTFPQSESSVNWFGQWIGEHS